MISVKISKNRNGYVGFTCSGHAGYANSGKDIVCASVSMLVINTINSIEELTDTKFNVKEDETTGFIDFKFLGDVSNDASLLMDSMVLGLRELSKEYKKHVTLLIKEV